MQGMDGRSWETGREGVICYTRGRLLAAFQDLKTIANEEERWDGIEALKHTVTFAKGLSSNKPTTLVVQ